MSAKKKVTKATGEKLRKEMRRSTPRKPPRACLVCGCTENHACANRCSWDRRFPELCSNCAGAGPFHASYNGMTTPPAIGNAVACVAKGAVSLPIVGQQANNLVENWIIGGPGKYQKAPTSLPFGTDCCFTQSRAESIADMLNRAFHLGQLAGSYKALRRKP